MRIFTMIICVYVLVLSLVPCGDAYAHDESSTTNKIEIPTTEHTDLCSSFCSCACCGQINYQTKEPIFSFNIQENFTQIVIPYQENIANNFFGFIWQPPKIIKF